MPLCWAWSCVPNVDRVPTGIGCVYVAEWGRYKMTLFAANAVRQPDKVAHERHTPQEDPYDRLPNSGDGNFPKA